MAVFKITLSVYGINFVPNKIISKLVGDFRMEGYAKGDKVPIKKSNRLYKIGNASFWNPQMFGKQNEGDSYEEWYVNFLEKNYTLFIDHGVEDIDLYIELYTIGNDQCNFEIFSKDMLKRLCKYNVSLPISVYVLTEKEMNELIE